MFSTRNVGFLSSKWFGRFLRGNLENERYFGLGSTVDKYFLLFFRAFLHECQVTSGQLLKLQSLSEKLAFVSSGRCQEKLFHFTSSCSGRSFNTTARVKAAFLVTESVQFAANRYLWCVYSRSSLPLLSFWFNPVLQMTKINKSTMISCNLCSLSKNCSFNLLPGKFFLLNYNNKPYRPLRKYFSKV